MALTWRWAVVRVHISLLQGAKEAVVSRKLEQSGVLQFLRKRNGRGDHWAWRPG
jgi:hypothetical protein